ncbi:ribonucleases P/MRP protein subunit POP1-domain-containing protein, partial [Dimargaris cristalligena]
MGKSRLLLEQGILENPAQRIPRILSLKTYIAPRTQDILGIKKAIQQAKYRGNTRAFQTLPRHLRRRVASHNVKRIPLRLRERARKEMDKVGQVPKKRLSRHKRRRPGCIADEYKRRQQEKRWLETHIWHTKRMKMAERWGCMIAEHPNEHNIKASYRASKYMVLATDVSYYACLELSGTLADLAAILAQLTDPTVDLPCYHPHYTKGHHQCTPIVYHPNAYPFKCIGPVTMLWRPTLSNKSPARTLWLLVHPALIREVTQVLTEARASRP